MLVTFKKFKKTTGFGVVTRRRVVLGIFGLPVFASSGGVDSNQSERNEFEPRVSDLLENTDVGQRAAPLCDEGNIVQERVHSAETVRDYIALRAYNGKASGIQITGINNQNCAPGFAGYFRHIPSDITSVDNGVTIIVDAFGRRWHRDWDGVNMQVGWAGATFAGGDETAAFQRCADAAGPGVTIHAKAGSALVSRQIIFSGKLNVSVFGHGCRISCGGNRFESIFKFTSCVGAAVSGFAFDLGKDRLPVYLPADYPNYFAQAVYFIYSKDNSFTDNSVENLYTAAVNFYGCDGGVVAGNRFTSPLQTQTQRIEFVVVLTCTGIFRVDRNRFLGDATTSSASAPCAVTIANTTGCFYVEENHTDYCGRNNVGTHRLACVDFYGNSDNVFVRHNTFKNTMGAAIRATNPHGFDVSHNSVTGSPSSVAAAYMILIASSAQTPTGNVSARDGIISYNVVDSVEGKYDYAIGVVATDWGAAAHNIMILGNTIRGPNVSVLLQGPMQNIDICDNTSEAENGAISISHYPAITAVLGSEVDGIFEDIRVENNSIIKIGRKPRGSGLIINLNKAKYAGSVGKIYVKKNLVRNRDATNTSLGVIVETFDGKGNFTIMGNEVDGFSSDCEIRSVSTAGVRRIQCGQASADNFQPSRGLIPDNSETKR